MLEKIDEGFPKELPKKVQKKKKKIAKVFAKALLNHSIKDITEGILKRIVAGFGGFFFRKKVVEKIPKKITTRTAETIKKKSLALLERFAIIASVTAFEGLKLIK